MAEANRDALGAVADQLEKILFPEKRTMTYASDSLQRAREIVRGLSIDDFHSLVDIVDARAYVAEQQMKRWNQISAYAAKEAALPTSQDAAPGEKAKS